MSKKQEPTKAILLTYSEASLLKGLLAGRIITDPREVRALGRIARRL